MHDDWGHEDFHDDEYCADDMCECPDDLDCEDLHGEYGDNYAHLGAGLTGPDPQTSAEANGSIENVIGGILFAFFVLIAIGWFSC